MSLLIQNINLTEKIKDKMDNICPNCGGQVSSDDLLCPHCNELIIDNPQETKVFVCPVCGAENPPGETKCRFCCSIMPETIA